MTEVVLASTSRYRAQLLKRLKVDFSQHAPDCDETPKHGESAVDLVCRLARSKASSVAIQYPSAAIIGSDQVACISSASGDEIIGKAHNHDTAISQLKLLSGQVVLFHTGLCVMRHDSDVAIEPTVVTTEAHFKQLDEDLIERYLVADKPYDCAASFKSESCGSWIVDKMVSNDPTAIIGLPLIETARMLDAFDVSFKSA